MARVPARSSWVNATQASARSLSFERRTKTANPVAELRSQPVRRGVRKP